MRHHRVFSRQCGVTFRHLSVGERAAAFLRDRRPDKTAANVAADTRGRLSAKTVEKMLERQSAPSTANVIILFETYGAAFMCALMGERAPDWLQAAGRAEARAALDADIAALEAEKRAIGA